MLPHKTRYKITIPLVMWHTQTNHHLFSPLFYIHFPPLQRQYLCIWSLSSSYGYLAWMLVVIIEIWTTLKCIIHTHVCVIHVPCISILRSFGMYYVPISPRCNKYTFQIICLYLLNVKIQSKIILHKLRHSYRDIFYNKRMKTKFILY